MSKAEIDAYLSALQKSGLVPKDQVSAVLSRIIREAGGRRIDAAYVAQCFEQAGLVTAWHNEKLVKGRYKGFFLGSYKLLGHIGTGGMSNIYLGEHVQMRRRVAVKVLPPTLTTNTSHLQRFIMESRVIASLDHPNIVRAYDIAHQGSFHYLVLEFVEGCDLRRTVEDRGPLPYEEAADYIRQAADGLHHAHSKGVVHRDVKPANLLVDTDGIVKVLDMGLTRIIDSSDPSLTLAHNEKLIGTVDYIAPEQANNSHNVDARADVYSLGCAFYYLLTGHPPFPDGSQTQRLMAHQQTPVKPVAEERPDCPPELWDILSRMMAKKVKDRIQSAGEVSRELMAWLQTRKGYTPKVVGHQGAPPGLAAPPPTPPVENTPAPGSIWVDSIMGRPTNENEWVGESLGAWPGGAPSSMGGSSGGSNPNLSWQQQLQAWQEALEAREANLTRRESEVAEQEKLLESRIGQLGRNQADVEQSQKKLAELEQYIEQRSQTLERKSEDIKALETKLHQLEDYIERRARELEARDDEVTAREAETAHLKNDLSKLQAQRAEIDRARIEHETRMAALAQTRAEVQKRQEAIVKQSDEATKRMLALSEQFRELEASRREMEAGRREIETGRRDLETGYKELTTAREIVKRELENGRREIEAGRREVQRRLAELAAQDAITSATPGEPGDSKSDS